MREKLGWLLRVRKARPLLLLDAIDRAILGEIEMNARYQNQDVARKVGLSPSACWQRIRRLEISGVIRRYITDIDFAEVEPSLQFSVGVTVTPFGRREQGAFETNLLASRNILSADQVTGRFDYILRVIGPDPSAWPLVRAEIDAEGRFIASAETHVLVRAAKKFVGFSELAKK
ncbi:MAG: AsnC family transcriptional regulator [Hyphomonadaceae bacterium]|nr:AsnC family transcriptional regulator [Hyphomonadaceae bacterium]